ncbi:MULTISPECIES: hypothetical protein [Actinomadura]|uniref:DUF3558 domain-containing protein n=1 Tax=Actinomadura litoris TaxID=2678616 RepID=A0A7K1L8M4_9ACTN|nr:MULTISPECIES: hypothetical protein [Actinomadura]MBT2210443.1 hypothetical protein [Actinomadura sp. NEAU-AAG7]MUN40566.1 hypothetical protein [Actinomadura litoris]
MSGSDRYSSGGETTPHTPRNGQEGRRSGSHRAVRERRPHRRRRAAIMLAGVGTGVVACAAAAFALLGGGDGGASGRAVGNGATESAPMTGTPTIKAERSLVPDACTLVGDDLAGRLAPGAARNQADGYQADDRQNQCVWGTYTGDRKRQLTVELRAIAAAAQRTPTDAARTAFASEREDDESGKGLPAGRELTEKRGLNDVGDEGYAVYSVDEGQGSGEAIANIRAINVLVTVHYAGSDERDPLPADAAVDGAVEAVRAVLRNLT